jgi:toxin ParE1/3/4
MSATYQLTPRAQEDLRNIGRYTLKTWGRKQRDSYLHAMERRFECLAENPQLGRHRPDVREGYYSYSQSAHVVFYLIREGGIDIIGVPHQRMDTPSYFSKSAEF